MSISNDVVEGLFAGKGQRFCDLCFCNPLLTNETLFTVLSKMVASGDVVASDHQGEVYYFKKS
jgi:hypothetical protein